MQFNANILLTNIITESKTYMLYEFKLKEKTFSRNLILMFKIYVHTLSSLFRQFLKADKYSFEEVESPHFTTIHFNCLASSLEKRIKTYLNNKN